MNGLLTYLKLSFFAFFSNLKVRIFQLRRYFSQRARFMRREGGKKHPYWNLTKHKFSYVLQDLTAMHAVFASLEDAQDFHYIGSKVAFTHKPEALNFALEIFLDWSLKRTTDWNMAIRKRNHVCGY